jgi:peptidoglycan-N-acetylglucosamine deacetylase
MALAASAAGAEPPCPGHPEALGTFRVLAVDPAATPRVGRKHFPTTLPLANKEVVLTFDDGPWPGTTTAVLDALERECVRATFFLLGRNAAAHPELARRELAEGHTVAHHSFHHPLLDRMSVAAAMAEIDHGFTAVDTALYGAPAALPHTPFFSAFPDLRRRRRCSIGWPSAASRCSAPTYGRVIGTRWRPIRSCGW